jgi:hypothetical protein
MKAGTSPCDTPSVFPVGKEGTVRDSAVKPMAAFLPRSFMRCSGYEALCPRC